MKRNFAFLFAILMVVDFLPFVVIGRSWGMLWYVPNLPLSALLKPVLWSSSNHWWYSLVVSALNAAIYAYAFSFVRARFRRS